MAKTELPFLIDVAHIYHSLVNAFMYVDSLSRPMPASNLGLAFIAVTIRCSAWAVFLVTVATDTSALVH